MLFIVIIERERIIILPQNNSINNNVYCVFIQILYLCISYKDYNDIPVPERTSSCAQLSAYARVK